MTRTRRPARCTSCNVRLRGTNDPYVPGTRRYGGLGLCDMCRRREKNGSPARPARPPRCTSCGRGWDVVRYGARGLCAGCDSARRYRPVVKRKRRPMPAACVSCKRPLRRRRDPVTPGTVQFGARGMCATCYNAAAAGRETLPVRTACVRCNRPMRTRGKAEPGFVVHQGNGLCRGCTSSVRRHEQRLLAYVLGERGEADPALLLILLAALGVVLLTGGLLAIVTGGAA